MSPLLAWILLLLYALLITMTATVVILENRTPAKTVAWIIVLVGMPVVGIVLFYFFGQNIRKERYIERNSYERLTHEMLKDHAKDAHLTGGKYQRLMEFIERDHRTILTSANATQLMETGREWIQALLRDFQQAQHHIHLQTYIIEDDAVGRLVADALVDCAKRGVEVRLLYDDVGCWNVDAAFFSRMQQAGIEVQPFLPVRFPSLTHRANYRNHRKVCIIDGRVGYVGGMNLALRYMREQGKESGAWRDLHLRMEGAAVHGLQRIFATDWYFMRKELLGNDAYFPLVKPQAPIAHPTLIQIVSANPVARYSDLMYSLTWVIQNAKRYLYIQTPYFMPPEVVLQALQTAALSGVDVRVMLPAKPDAYLLRWGNASYVEDALAAGIKVYEYRSGFLHSKCAVADDDWCTIGSTNMDARSFDNNFETNAFIYDSLMAERVRQRFVDDMQACQEMDLATWRKRPLYKKFMESLTRIFSPIL